MTYTRKDYEGETQVILIRTSHRLFVDALSLSPVSSKFAAR